MLKKNRPDRTSIDSHHGSTGGGTPYTQTGRSNAEPNHSLQLEFVPPNQVDHALGQRIDTPRPSDWASDRSFYVSTSPSEISGRQRNAIGISVNSSISPQDRRIAEESISPSIRRSSIGSEESDQTH